jgi:AcrR family transcriptional regulator
METPHRLLRAVAEDADPKLRDLSTRDLDRRDRIFEVAQTLFSRFGRHGVTFRGLAAANHMSPVTLRRFFLDIDALLGELFVRHMRMIATFIGRVSADDPDRHRLYRAAYIAATRTGFGAPTQAHMLFTMYRPTLPDDIAYDLNQARLALGDMISGSADRADELLELLDTPTIDPEEIELIWQRRIARTAAFAKANAAPPRAPVIDLQNPAKPSHAAPPPPDPELDDLTLISGVTKPGFDVRAHAPP